MPQLVELSDTRNGTTSSIVIDDYDQHPRLCRAGIWVGVRTEFSETIVLSYEHDAEELYVGWKLNGVSVIDPGYSSGTPPWGFSVPGASDVTYTCPVDDLFHRIQFRSTAGHQESCISVQVLTRTPAEEFSPPELGPSTITCVAGYDLSWPSANLEAERRCLASLLERLRVYTKVKWVPPGDPPERWIELGRPEELKELLALFETLENLNSVEDEDIAKAVQSNLIRRIQTLRSPGRKSPAPFPASGRRGRAE